MKVEYSHLKMEEIEQIREESLLDVPGTMIEDTLLVLRMLPCLIADGLLIHFILRLNATIIYPNLSPKISQFISRITGEIGITKASVLLLLSTMICVTSMICVTLLVVFAYLAVGAVNTVFMFLLKKLIPIATPCIEQNKRNRKFYNDTEHILQDLVTEDEVRQCLSSEADIEIYLNDNILEFYKKKEGYTKKIEVELSGRLKAHLESSNVLDFTYLDDEWKTALAEKV